MNSRKKAHAPASAGPTQATMAVVDIPLKQIDASDDTFRQRAIIAVEDLVAELRMTPQQVPVFLRQRAEKRYQIVAGFRRVHALKELGRASARAIVLTCSDAEAWRLAWAENVAHRKLRGLDLSYLVFRLHEDGHNAEEIAHLCGMTTRDAERVGAIGRMPEAVRALVREHGLTLRHAAVVAAFVARHPRIQVDLAVASAAHRGLNEANLALALEALVAKQGRPLRGVTFRHAQHVAIDMARAQPAAWTESVQKRMHALRAWLDEALAAAAAAKPKRRRTSAAAAKVSLAARAKRVAQPK